VTTSMRVRGPTRLSSRTRYPTVSPTASPRAGHERRGGAGRQPPRLEHHDPPPREPGLVEQRQRDARGLARAGRRVEHGAAVVAERGAEGGEDGYPTAPHFRDGFTTGEHQRALAQSNEGDARPLSLYLHIPFCAKLCTYCGCHMMVTQRPEKVTRYVMALQAEIDLVAEHLDSAREVVQVHWGGGTPNSLAPHEIEHLMTHVRSRFRLAPHAEVSIECDPRTLTGEHLAAMRRAGFDRISLGVQSFDPLVQEAIGRVQPVGMVASITAQARYEGFSGINFDLLYGLPHQTPERFARTLDAAVALGPHRVSLFGYAHVPWMKKHQRLIPEDALPGPDARLALFAQAYERFTASGYVPVGMDHFALPDDPLAQAQAAGALHRNFQGYTTRAGDADVVGFGVSAISDLGRAYAQNHKGLLAYYRAIESRTLPTGRGLALSDEDRLRRRVIRDLMCGFAIEKAPIEARYGIRFDEHFADALARLAELESLGVVVLAPERVLVTERGRPFVRNAAMAFDAYLRQPGAPQQRYSQTV
jgi:oxygen-independent coproporphyrinogen III oxidase